MDITKIIGIGIIGTILSVTVKGYRPEIGLGTALLTGVAVLFAVLPQLESVILQINKICESSQINSEYFKVVIKIIGAAYITRFSSQLAQDAGEGVIAKKLEFAGKVCVLAMMMPTVTGLLDVILTTLADF